MISVDKDSGALAVCSWDYVYVRSCGCLYAVRVVLMRTMDLLLLSCAYKRILHDALDAFSAQPLNEDFLVPIHQANLGFESQRPREHKVV